MILMYLYKVPHFYFILCTIFFDLRKRSSVSIMCSNATDVMTQI